MPLDVALIPRALPWAGMFLPFQGESQDAPKGPKQKSPGNALGILAPGAGMSSGRERGAAA